MRKLATLSLSLIAAAAFAAPAATAAPPPGGLNAVSCIGNPTEGPAVGCAADSATIAGLHDIALSPDGRQLYAIGGSQGDGIAGRVLTFARNADTGALTFAGCIGPVAAGCTADSRLGFSNALALSPDGADLYVADYNGVVRYRRAADGGLTYAECATSTVVSGCDLAPGVAAASGVTVSPNGDSVYVAGYIDDAVVAFSRNSGSGDLAWLGCRTTGSHPLCNATPGTGLDAATDVVVSPNGARVYASARNGNAVATLDRAPAGTIGTPRVLADDYLDGAQALAVAPDGNALYAGLFDGSGLTALGLDPGTGDPSLLGCLMPEATSFCGASPGVNTVFGFGFSPDGDVLYAASRNGGSVGAFRRGPNGALSLIACTHAPEAPAEGCGETASGIANAQAVAAAADGRFVYVAGGATIATLRPEPTPPPVTPTPDAKPKPLSLKIVTKRARLTKRGKLAVKLRCVSSPTGRCTGRLAARSAKKLDRRLKSGKIAKRYLKLGARGFSIAAGKTATVTIAVPKAAQGVVGANGSLRIQLSATAKRPAGKPLVIKRKIKLLEPR